MIKCPYCKEEIHDDASKCKHCGEWLTKKDDVATPESTSSLKKDVVLILAGNKKIQVLKAVREKLSCGLKEAKDIIDNVPSIVASGIDDNRAEEFKVHIEKQGATVEITEVGQNQSAKRINPKLKIKKCKKCGNEVVQYARNCPQCGVKDPTNLAGTMRIITLVGLVIFVILLLLSVGDKTKPVVSTKKESAHSEVAKVVEVEKPIIVPAHKMCFDFSENAVAAKIKYKDKLVQVTGIVTDIVAGFGKGTSVVLNDGINCCFDDNWTESIAKLTKGQELTIQGKCDGTLMNILMGECKIIKH